MNSANKDIPVRYVKWKIKREEMEEDLSKIVLFVRAGMQKDLRRFQGIEGSHLLYSLWSGYLEDERTNTFISDLTEMGISMESLHTSGHATIDTLKRMVDILHPKTIIPVHTFHPESFSTLGASIKLLYDGQCVEV
jgi:ribonuclease J